MQTAATGLDTVARTALLLAFEPEWNALLPYLEEVQAETRQGATYVTGRIGATPVVMALSGISMVNATMAAQRLLNHFTVSRLIMSGIAGGIDPQLSIGDIVAPETWSQPMETLAARQTPQGPTPPGWLWGMSARQGFGMWLPRQVRIGTTDYDTFPADPDLIVKAHQLEGVVVGGEAVSATAFIDNAEYRHYLHTVFKARIADMESAAVAQVAFVNHVPFIAFRAVSDLAGGDSDSNVMMEFMAHAAERSASVVAAFVKTLATDN